MTTERAIELLQEMIDVTFDLQTDVEYIQVLKYAIDKLRGYENAVTALKEINKYNNIGNDLKAYLFHVAEWGMGDEREKPNTNDYGIIE